mmetsp:Transcript_6196/g.18324  ORF Transcript_6196/g.18324 Transcript_6196/m.18324 type:complete len:444 (+) Transcript_6196:324-1655(+)|eukprot:CAMPEP_0119549268 /NCGR_PEP_ID=MMETSP1352-20130426/3000_1 /TAXON_ID=265584 /ORGANISM="Stauroneis constricta, Strain CCMP1120" /LENGTH=443 /DNA_ID=CAMNT_0007594787 /DNA_START=319 /DNA_END=1650 /DNA_ORIENTATION=-
MAMPKTKTKDTPVTHSYKNVVHLIKTLRGDFGYFPQERAFRESRASDPVWIVIHPSDFCAVLKERRDDFEWKDVKLLFQYANVVVGKIKILPHSSWCGIQLDGDVFICKGPSSNHKKSARHDGSMFNDADRSTIHALIKFYCSASSYPSAAEKNAEVSVLNAKWAITAILQFDIAIDKLKLYAYKNISARMSEWIVKSTSKMAEVMFYDCSFQDDGAAFCRMLQHPIAGINKVHLQHTNVSKADLKEALQSPGTCLKAIAVVDNHMKRTDWEGWVDCISAGGALEDVHVGGFCEDQAAWISHLRSLLSMPNVRALNYGLAFFKYHGYGIDLSGKPGIVQRGPPFTVPIQDGLETHLLDVIAKHGKLSSLVGFPTTDRVEAALTTKGMRLLIDAWIYDSAPAAIISDMLTSARLQKNKSAIFDFVHDYNDVLYHVWNCSIVHSV